MFNSSTYAVTLYTPPVVYTPGSTISGEVEIDFRQLQEEKIEAVFVHLRGSFKTWLTGDEAKIYENTKLVDQKADLWSRGAVYPSAGEHVLRVPFSLTLPASLPPPLLLHDNNYTVQVKYAIAAIGRRKGALTLNKKHRIPLVVLPAESIGARIREENVTHEMKVVGIKEEHIRKGLWGDYSKVQIELELPNIPVLPLFSDIPYAITITTTSAPLSKAKADAHPADKPVFPPLPETPHGIVFGVYWILKVHGKYHRGTVSNNGTRFLGGKEGSRNTSPVGVEAPRRAWVPLDATGYSEKGNEKEAAGPQTTGVWVQRATYRSTFKLNCPPSFEQPFLRCSHQLHVKVAFPGVGNAVKLEVPVTIASGIDKPLAQTSDDIEGPSPLELPPAYWNDADDRTWDDEKY